MIHGLSIITDSLEQKHVNFNIFLFEILCIQFSNNLPFIADFLCYFLWAKNKKITNEFPEQSTQKVEGIQSWNAKRSIIRDNRDIRFSITFEQKSKHLLEKKKDKFTKTIQQEYVILSDISGIPLLEFAYTKENGTDGTLSLFHTNKCELCFQCVKKWKNFDHFRMLNFIGKLVISLDLKKEEGRKRSIKTDS